MLYWNWTQLVCTTSFCESRTVSTDNDVPMSAVDPRYYVIRDVIVI